MDEEKETGEGIWWMERESQRRTLARRLGLARGKSCEEIRAVIRMWREETRGMAKDEPV